MRAREESARLEALRQAEVERARVEAEQRARMEALVRQQEHERQMAQIAQDSHKKKLQKLVAVSSIGGVLVLGTALGVYFGKIKPEAERQAAEQAAAIAAQEQQQQRLEAELKRREGEMTALRDQLKSAASEKERLEIQSKIDALDRKPAPGAAGGARPGGNAPAAGAKPKCNAGDPMCADF
jgi:colicin import membrane protein